MSLKTLEDIRIRKKFHGCRVLGTVVEIERLKQEAIKHIKEKDNLLDTLNENNSNSFMVTTAIIEWIKHFFNITEEDLE